MRNNISKLAFTVALMLAITFTFSCSGGDGGGETYAYCIYSAEGFCSDGPFTTCQGNGLLSNSCPYPPTSSPSGVSSSSSKPSGVSSSSVTAPSSSSVAVSSSSSKPSSSSGTSSPSVGGSSNSGGTNKCNSIANCKTKQIGNQTWLAENLNIDVEGSVCYDKDPANCDKYGRLYDWATAMALPASCNSNPCASQITTPHRGICPSGWHIPSDEDWDVLMTAVGGSSTAGTKLKAREGWNGGGNGEDTYGFSALPGGYGNSGGSFDIVGSSGYWWSASENNSSLAYRRGMDYSLENANYSYSNKVNLFSVRCVKD